MIISEDICGRAIDKIPGIENNPELRKQLEEEFYYFLDVVISHDGEATKLERNKKTEEYSSIKEAVKAKMKLANSRNDYKFIAQTSEGKIGKYSDVIAYMASDILDGFRMGQITGFDDKYLELFGEALIDNPNATSKQKIEYAKTLLKQIKKDKVRELKTDIYNKENSEILTYLNDIIKRAEEKGIDLSNVKPSQEKELAKIVERQIKELQREREKQIRLTKKKDKKEIRNKKRTLRKSSNKFTISKNQRQKLRELKKDVEERRFEEKQYLYSDINKLREFVEKIKSINTSVVGEVTSRLQEFIVKDIIQTSLKCGDIRISERAERVFDGIRKKNIDEIVIHTKWDFQLAEQPVAAMKICEVVTESLIKSGVIRDKFYDKSIRRYITDEDALKCMRVGEKRREKQYETYKKRVNNKVKKAKTGNKRYSGKKSQRSKYSLFKSVYKFAQREGETFADRYMNVYDAIPHTVSTNVELALSDKPDLTDILETYQEVELKKIRNKIIAKYGTHNITKTQKQEFIEQFVREERQAMERKMAMLISIDYISGMTDESFNELAISTGYMNPKIIKRSRRGSTTIKKLEKLSKQIGEER